MLREALETVLKPGGPWLFVKLVVLAFTAASVIRLIPVRRKALRRRQRRGRTGLSWSAGVLACLVVSAGGAVVLLGHGGRSPRDEPAARALSGTLAARPASYLGVFEPVQGSSYQPVEHFAATVGRRPDMVLTYRAWLEPFDAGFADTLHDHGAEPFIQIEPGDASLTAIAAGRYDAYLRAYATRVREFGHPVILGFAPEANGNWYPWGWTRSSPAAWVAAWRHVVTIFRQQEADNVTWIWTVNESYPGSGPLRDYWPGAAYVDWAGIDGYYDYRKDTFARVFGPAVNSIRKLTRKPVLLAETAAGQVAGQARIIPGLFAGIRRDHLLGLVWFDQAQHSGIHHQDWRLEGHPAAIAAFRREVKHYR